LVGVAEARIVGGGSLDDGSDSTRAVPSIVQKLSHSSSKVWLQVGQRFILRKSFELCPSSFALFAVKTFYHRRDLKLTAKH